MVTIAIEGKIKPLRQGERVADFADIDGDVPGLDAAVSAAAKVDQDEAITRDLADVALGERIDLLPSGGGGGIAGTSTKVVNRAAYSYDVDTLETLTFDATEHEIVDIIIRTTGVTSTGATPSISLSAGTALVISYSGSSLQFLPTSNLPGIKHYAILARVGGAQTVKLLRNSADILAITVATLEVFLVRAGGGGRSGATDQTARDAASTAQTAADGAKTLADANKVTADAAQTETEVEALISPETTARQEGDTMLGVRIDALGARAGATGGGDVLFNDTVNLTTATANSTIALDDTIAVPTTGVLEFFVYGTASAFAGTFTIPVKTFITKTAVLGGAADQGSNQAFAFPIGQNRSFSVSSRVEVGTTTRRFLIASSDGLNYTVLVLHVEGNGLGANTVTEDQLTSEVKAKLNQVYSPGPTPNIFNGVDRAAAIAAVNKYLDGVSVITQASVRIYSDADNYITVSMHADVAVGPKGNKWKMKWGGDSDSPGGLEVDTADSIFQATVKWDSGASTLDALHDLFHGDSKFESVVTGDDTLIASITETFGEDVVGNTIFFAGGNRVHTNVPDSWFTHYTDNLGATITLQYQARQEMQVWDASLIDFRTAFTLLDSPTKPDPFVVLTHPNISTENWQWAVSVTTAEARLRERSGGTVKAPVFPADIDAVQLVVPTDSKEVSIRITNGDEIDQAFIARLALPSGSVVDAHIGFVLKDVLMQLRINSEGHVFVKRATAGTTIVGCDIWHR